MRAAPPVDEASVADVDRAWNRIAATVEPRPSRRRRGWKTALGSLAAVAVIGTSTVAAAEFYSAYTGRGPSDAEDLRLGGPGEKLDVGASDYAQVVDEVTRDVPFPTAAARASAVAAQVRDAGSPDVGEEFVSTGALRAWVADAAVCAWSNQWAAATRRGNAQDRSEAIGVLHKAPAWPAVVALDPNPSTRVESGTVTGADGVTRPFEYRDDSQFYYLAELGDAVDGTDVSAVALLLAENNGYCTPELVPDIPRANPMYGGR